MKNLEARLLFGFGILLAIIVLAVIIALGPGAFSQWAFSKANDKPEPPK